MSKVVSYKIPLCPSLSFNEAFLEYNADIFKNTIIRLSDLSKALSFFPDIVNDQAFLLEGISFKIIIKDTFPDFISYES